MKLKNSYVLLMVMAIFLLISVGSVCASEIADVDDVVSADDGSDVVLANESAAPTIDTKIVSDDNVRIEKGQDQKIPVTVNDNASKPISVSKGDLKVSKGSEQLNFTYSNDEIKLSKNLTSGNHSLLITYLGNDIYKNSTKNIILSIVGDYKINVDKDKSTIDQSNKAEVPITVTNDVDTKSLTRTGFNIRVGSVEDSVRISPSGFENGKLIFNIPESVENITSKDITITYSGIPGKTLTTTTKLKRVTAIKIIPIISEAYYQDGNFTFKVVDFYNETKVMSNQTISISGQYNKSSIYWDIKQTGGNSISLSTTKNIKTDANGIATLNNINFYPGLIIINTDIYAPAGTYNVTVSAGNGFTGQYVGTIKIKKVTAKVSVVKYSEYFGTNKNVKITVVNAETNKPLVGVPVYFKMTDSAGKEITFTTTGANNTTVRVNTISTNSKGSFELPISNLMPGSYSVATSLNESTSYSASKHTGAVTVKKIPIKYTISTTGKITVTNKLTGKKVPGAIVLIKYDKSKNKQFITQTTTGVIEIVTVGKHTVQVVNEDPRYSAKAVTKTISNKKITAKASAPKVTTYYKAEKYFTVKLTNSAKKPIYDAKLNIKVYVSSSRYYNYKGNTGIDGKINLGLDSLKPGTYKVVVTSGATKNFALKKVTSKIVVKKAPAKLTPTKLTAKKGVKKYFKVTVKNTKTKKVIKGVKVKIKVYTGKKYKTYTVKTNSKGIANLNVKSLKVGSHKVVVSSANKYVVAKAAKSTIKITKK
ncbi:MAG: hypothetical protein IKH85_06730 [Methanobrevibacter sp.]|uniref:hypothetical protein n=1 Tax=Methanobrevibacter sp. TaxID=66852 RepID=UPI0025EC5F49|nr:hypothetical protein [Methanobrevibacter sp.]MBR6993750.1 hypothetical protein [Methanobrevibacter sp.]